ncbi:MAG TPA: SDR family oxidoreductase [Spirochaetota bacterium]|nr:SDR family oxidoreductase [Spirochaetota bacterium]
MSELKGKNAVITGASKGVGQALACSLSRQQVNVALIARSEKKLDNVVRTAQEYRGQAYAVPADLSDTGETEKAAARCRRLFQDRIDILINNAGVFMEQPVPATEPSQWDRLMAVNLKAPFMLCKLLLPLMQQQQSGHIINIASTSAHKGHLNQAAYCASKHGLLGFSRALAMEAKPYRVRVSCLSPGGIDTDFIAGSQVAVRIKNEAVLQPNNIAALVLFVLSQPANTSYPEITLERFK